MPYVIRHYLSTQCDWLPEFDQHTFSCDIGCIKPDLRIYQHCLEGLSLQPEQVLFLDDRPENIEAAQSLAMNCIVFTTAEEAAAQIKSKYVLPEIFP